MTKAAALASPEGPPFPEPLDYLWMWFVLHSMGMASGGMSYPVITWEGLHAWSSQMQIDLEPWEAEVMVTLSVARANVHAEKMEAERKKMNTSVPGRNSRLAEGRAGWRQGIACSRPRAMAMRRSCTMPSQGI